jgi:hypothetical protein
MRFALIRTAFFAAFLAVHGIALADDGGEGGTNGDSSATASIEDASGGEDASDITGDVAVVIACDGALCGTESGSACGIASGSPGGKTGTRPVLAAAAALLALGIARKTKRGASCPS